MMIGVIVNTALVLVGSVIGLVLRRGIPDRIKTIVMSGLGLFTCILGAKMGIEMTQPLLVVLSIVVGGALGQILHIEEGLEILGLKLRHLVRSQEGTAFAEGFVFSSLLFCVGPMTILGCIEAGLRNRPDLLFVKSLMDGVSAIILASSLGFGVLFSTVTVLVIQGALVLLAQQLTFLTDPLYLHDFTAVGGIIIFGIGIKLLGLKQMKVGNFLPALVLIVLFIFFTTLL
jgi:uncharacterized membrane protein YqgA involved in biofilm formation